MKKILGLVLVFIYFVTPAFAAEPISQEILDQARAQAGLFMDLKNALGLDWLDKYNAYLEDPDGSSKPSWESSVTALINKNYLSSSFPTDFQITPTGQEVTISRTITNQGIKNALPIYLPSVVISGDTVSLLVQRPAQWVAWEAGLNSKISRDGGDDPDVLPDASLEFGAGSEIEFINNDGKLVGIDSLTYKGQELEERFVNASGDNMTGPLTIEGNKVWHAGNDGSGSGLDADLLDGRSGSFYQNADNLNAGIVPTARLSGTYNISISGNAATATNANYASSAGNADTVDGKHASDFALSGHTHGYVLKAGDTMIGPLGVNFENGITSGIGSHNIKGTGSTDVVGKGFKINWDTDFGFVGLVDKGRDRKDMVFANEQTGDNFVFMSQGMEIMALKPASKTLEIDGNKVWHAGNDGSGSGLDADTLDGKHASELAGCPPGTIMFFASPTPPSGWLECNGAYISISEYPALYSVIGTTFGSSSGKFRLPDLRGEFIRGWDNGRGVDPGRGFGTWQADEFKSHRHGARMAHWEQGTGWFTYGNSPRGLEIYYTEYAGGNETRPRNIALLPCIKY